MRHADQVRVAFLVGWRGGASTGPFQKIAEQLRIWQELGATVALFAATSDQAADDWQQLGFDGEVVTPHAGAIGKLRQRTATVNSLLAWKPDVVYERHSLFYPALEQMSRRVPTVIEVNGDDVAEWRALSRAKHLYNLATRRHGLRLARGVVFVTKELSRSPRFDAARHAEASVVANGIDLESIREAGPSRAEEPRLVFVGHPGTPWHGIEQLPDLAHDFPEWRIDAIGPSPGDFPNGPPNLVAHGEMRGAGYRTLLEQADIGIGSLAMFRAGLQEGCPLKLREYLAHGLPAIIGYRDTDFPDPPPFLLQVPNASGSLRHCRAEVQRFVYEWHGRRVPRSAITHLDVRVKEAGRLEFISAVARRSE